MNSRRTTEEKGGAIGKAFAMLSRRDYSTRRLIEKLIEKGFDADEARAAADELTRRGYLDDGELCRERFERLYGEGRLSLRQIERKLSDQGFSEEMIESLLPEEDASERELSAARRALRSRYGAAPPPAQKMGQYLWRKGFDGDICREAAEAYLEEVTEDGFEE